MAIPILGNSWESFETMPHELALQLAMMGTRFVRIFVFWDSCNPQKGVFDWTKPDADIDAVSSAKMQVYFNFYWCPEWACGGFKTYLPYTAGCSTLINGVLGFARNLDYCVNPPPIDPDAAFAFGKAAAERYGSKVDYWGVWNEPGGQNYWPRPDDPPSFFDVFARLVNQVVLPFTKGVRSVLPDAKFVGMEADSHGLVGDMLQAEKDTGVRLFDAIGIHTYPEGKLPDEVDDAFRRIDQDYLPIMKDLRGDREVWVTEMGFAGYPGDPYTQKVTRFINGLSDRGISRVSFHGVKQWFAPGVINDNTWLLAAGQAGYKPRSATYTAVQRIIIPERRHPNETTEA